MGGKGYSVADLEACCGPGGWTVVDDFLGLYDVPATTDDVPSTTYDVQ